MTTCIIFNPTARGDKARILRAKLAEFERQAALKPTSKAGDARRLATEALHEGFTTIVAAGGDGTVNEVLNGIADAPGGLERARLGVIPFGTANVFAKELAIPARLDAAWKVVLAGVERCIDLPVAEFVNQGRTERRCFAQLAGAGLDSRSIAELSWEQKKLLGVGAYFLAGLRAMQQTLPRIQVELDDGRTDSGELVLLGNGRYYGGRLRVFPGAELSDGRLHVMVGPRISILTMLRGGADLLLDRFDKTPVARHYQTASVRLTSESPCELELEGDNVGMLPATATIRPKALRVVAP